MKLIVLKSVLLVMIVTVSGCVSTDSKDSKLESQQIQNDSLESNAEQAPTKPKVEMKRTYTENGNVDYITTYEDGIVIEKKNFTYYESGELEKETYYINGLKDGVETTYYTDGNIFIVKEYKAGMINGESIVYYSSGQVKYHDNYKNDKRIGLSKYYLINGSIGTESVFEDGRSKSGVVYKYDENNNLKWSNAYWSKTYKDSRRNIITNYYPNGQVSIERNLIDGRMEGIYNSYYKNGNLKYEVTMKNNNREGAYKEYFSSGELKQEIHYKNASRIGESRTYFVTGTLDSTTNYKNGERVSLKDYTKSGAIHRDLTYKNSNKSGVQNSFFDTGELSWETLYKDGERTNSTQYYMAGNIAAEIEFKDGKAVKGFNYTFEGKKTSMTNAHFNNLGYEY
jgi:antitoxin component YwqK of YwqJK toxin-antitoxin module